jgi:cytochrome oxidase assembly protein ShyY1
VRFLPDGRLRPRLTPTLATLIGVVILGRLCVWQLDRHQFKNRWVEQAHAAAVMPEVEGISSDLHEVTAILFRHVRLEGRFDGPVMLEAGRGLKHGPGYAVVQRFVTTDGVGLLIDRGEVVSAAEALSLSSPTSVEGRLAPLPEDHDRDPVPGTDPEIWARRSMVGIHRRAGEVLPGVYLRAGQALAPDADPVPAPVLATGYRPYKKRYDSLHYAKQWAAMALILLGLWSWASWERTPA